MRDFLNSVSMSLLVLGLLVNGGAAFGSTQSENADIMASNRESKQAYKQSVHETNTALSQGLQDSKQDAVQSKQEGVSEWQGSKQVYHGSKQQFMGETHAVEADVHESNVALKQGMQQSKQDAVQARKDSVAAWQGQKKDYHNGKTQFMDSTRAVSQDYHQYKVDSGQGFRQSRRDAPGAAKSSSRKSSHKS